MTTLNATAKYRRDAAVYPYGGYSRAHGSSLARESTRDEKEILSIISPMFGMLTMGAVATGIVSGQFPWFLVPLSLLWLLAISMPWK